ncbi:sodium/proton antiporter, CPA1 family [Nakamurella panacisegetis]|uniref:Sodium/proton antiporter, CPA1 family n=1 Tax=Nakamurella panacisegetis TaxID=1090615 RepID=A0A1H0T6W9_9ACTN|nr:Na+/H+ antiporter [Nakamurella panacisegetis]SDP49792.1 sodium/proton antiporter, CPA1 family [Nakamurella panacisegetis]
MIITLPVLGLLAGVLLVTALARRLSIPSPILLVVAGFAVSFLPGIPAYQVSPEVVLSVLLPPLLFGAAFESSAVALRALLRPIVQLAVLLVLLTAFTVAFALTAVLPGIPFGAALALGAILAPPDAVAAVAVARKVGLPRNLLTVLEGESLFNDATSLVTLKVAVATIGAGSVSFLHATGEFAWASVGGLLIGAAIGFAVAYGRRHIGSALTITAMTLLCPFAAYVVGESAGASGVLVVVVSGLIIGHRSPAEVAVAVRLTEDATWATLRFTLEATVFALVGLQLRGVFASLDMEGHQVLPAIVVVLATVILSRPLWLYAIHLAVRLIPVTTAATGVAGVAALSWAGMRGVVSLAAAQTLPLHTPYRSLLLVCTIAVIIGTLGLQGPSLPLLIRRLHLTEDRTVDDLRERASAHAEVNAAINRRVDELVEAGQLSDRQADLMRKWAGLRDWRNWDDEGKSRAFGQRLSILSDWRRSLLGIERSVIVSMRNSGELSENVLIEMQHDLDLEEALLERRGRAVEGHLEEIPSADDEARGMDAGPPTEDDTKSDQSRAVDGGGPVDDADVGAVMLDEQRADGPTIRSSSPGTPDS